MRSASKYYAPRIHSPASEHASRQHSSTECPPPNAHPAECPPRDGGLLDRPTSGSHQEPHTANEADGQVERVLWHVERADARRTRVRHVRPSHERDGSRGSARSGCRGGSPARRRASAALRQWRHGGLHQRRGGAQPAGARVESGAWRSAPPCSSATGTGVCVRHQVGPTTGYHVDRRQRCLARRLHSVTVARRPTSQLASSFAAVCPSLPSALSP